MVSAPPMLLLQLPKTSTFSTPWRLWQRIIKWFEMRIHPSTPPPIQSPWLWAVQSKSTVSGFVPRWREMECVSAPSAAFRAVSHCALGIRAFPNTLHRALSLVWKTCWPEVVVDFNSTPSISWHVGADQGSSFGSHCFLFVCLFLPLWYFDFQVTSQEVSFETCGCRFVFYWTVIFKIPTTYFRLYSLLGCFVQFYM